MKTKEELNALKEETKAIQKKLAELTDDELQQVIGGMTLPESQFLPKDPDFYQEFGNDWTRNDDEWDKKIEVTNAGTYQVEFHVNSKDE